MTITVKLLLEALAVGISNVIMVLTIYLLFRKMINIKEINIMNLVYICFISGFLLHLLFELLKLNFWYCKNGNACL